MFRISKSDEQTQTTLVIDGHLCGDGVITVEACCDEEVAKGNPVRLLMRDLTNIDEAGKALLGRLVDKGVTLLASGVYTSYVVEMITAAKTADSGMTSYGRVRDYKRS
jgi:ABC-type transporter Mla MlaB component